MMVSEGHYVDELLDVFAADPDRVVLHWRDEVFTAARCRELVYRAACALRDNGIGAGDTVALLTVTNSPATLLARYAGNLLGATVMHIGGVNAADPLDEVSVETQREVWARSGSAVLVTDADRRAHAGKVVAGTEGRLLGWGFADADIPDLLVGESDSPVEATTGGIATVVYTSGTTGLPKGVGRTFAALDMMIGGARQGGGRLVMMVTTPVTQSVSGMADGVLAGGGTLILRERFEAGDVLATIQRYRVNRLYLATPQLYLLVDHPDRGGADLSSLHEIYYGGCVAAPARLRQAVEAFGEVLAQVYGSTESWAIAGLTPEEHLRPELLHTVGKPVPFAELRICDPETRTVLAAGATGEVCLRSPMMMQGYWRAPELTERVLIDGWLHTGDIGYFDDDGYLHLVDRLSEMIKTNGVKIYPSEVEKSLLAYPGIAQAAVFGVADSDYVENIHAVVVPDGDGENLAERLREHIAAELSAAHVPAVVRFCTELPLTEAGKPDKRALAAQAK
ncbi:MULTISPECIES: class I adenylate-forming enzyme family protein [unclassified Nocardia]|uniref:class I adenylate-forming enzyme family protein n=1 Tax=unclassified Nocardia TaxID=2637762 RepID=UPI001CE4496B|nr:MULTISPECIES: AMP-binding protein [unclassified Nocardia]